MGKKETSPGEVLSEASNTSGLKREERGKGINPTEVLELNEILAKLERIDLNKVVEEKEALARNTLTPMERLVEDLSKNRKVSRTIRGRGGPKLSKKERVRRRNEYRRNIERPRAKVRLAEALTTPEGWWEFVRMGWIRRGLEVGITKEQFVEKLYPLWGEKGYVPVFKRINTGRKKVTLEGLIVYETGGKVLFDGSEHRMQRLGYIL